MKPARSPATYQDVLAAPEGANAELIDGELFLHPRPAKPHTLASSTLQAQLHVAFQLGRGGPGGWWILHEPELHVGPQVLVPDVAGWRRADLPELDLSLAYFTEVPSWICEVLSPGNESFDRVKKLRLYGQHGVHWAWLVHPQQRTLEAFELRGGAWALVDAHQDDGVVRVSPFDELELELETLWA
jgi:Uma2 family endonuclease